MIIVLFIVFLIAVIIGFRMEWDETELFIGGLVICLVAGYNLGLFELCLIH